MNVKIKAGLSNWVTTFFGCRKKDFEKFKSSTDMGESEILAFSKKERNL